MKIIGTDNFDRDNVDDFLVADHVSDTEMATIIVDALNAKFCNHDNAPTFFKSVPDEYKLHVFEP